VLVVVVASGEKMATSKEVAIVGGVGVEWSKTSLMTSSKEEHEAMEDMSSRSSPKMCTGKERLLIASCNERGMLM
jgi:hypothetical protein